MRKLEELIEKSDPAWPIVQAWLREATNQVEVLPPCDPDRAQALLAAQVTTRSPMGTIIYETGGLLIDSGWLRILGSGHLRLPRTLPGWNLGRTVNDDGQPPPFLLIADDVLGGFFAINGGGLGPARGNVFYFAPDGLVWEDLERGYSDFLHWCLTGDIAHYYGGHRWPGWEAEVQSLAGDRGYLIYPPLWSPGPSIAQRHRGPVSLSELYELLIGRTSE